MTYWLFLSEDGATTRHPLPAVVLGGLENASQPHQIADLRGPLLLNFWASWCVTCQAENKILKSLRDDGINIVGVSFRDRPEDAQQWLKTHGSPYQQVLIDSEGVLAGKLGVKGAPETFLIDSEGNVRFHYQGLIQHRVWEERIQPIYERLTPHDGTAHE